MLQEPSESWSLWRSYKEEGWKEWGGGGECLCTHRMKPSARFSSPWQESSALWVILESGKQRAVTEDTIFCVLLDMCRYVDVKEYEQYNCLFKEHKAWQDHAEDPWRRCRFEAGYPVHRGQQPDGCGVLLPAWRRGERNKLLHQPTCQVNKLVNWMIDDIYINVMKTKISERTNVLSKLKQFYILGF